MEEFFRVIKELQTNEEHWTAVGIDGALAGQKAVMREKHVIYQTEGFPKEAGQLLMTFPGQGLYETPWGRIFVEALGARKKLILCGGGHVSAAVLSIARMMEFHITVLEDRPDFARAAEAAGADQVICDSFTHGLARLETDRDTYVIIMTRGHRHDLDCLRQMLKKEYAYLGMMGSRARVRKIREQLTEEGFLQEKIDSLHAPIGLPISAATPAEIAVSIMAEVIQEKNRADRREGYEKELAAWLFSEPSHGEVCPAEPAKVPVSAGAAVLATIVARKGSAPRQTGTKMLIFADGSSLGTIGGGCMEAEVKSQARHMLAKGEERYKTCFADMTGRDAEEEGMVCGGTLEIFLEIL